MKAFTQLFTQLDQTTKTNAKLDALVEFLHAAPDQDKVWAIALLSGKRPRRTIKTGLLREWAAIAAQIPMWLFEQSYHVVGDLAETIALLAPDKTTNSEFSLAEWMERIQHLKVVSDLDKQRFVFEAWQQLDQSEKFVFNKLITGGFRIGVSQKLMTRALAKYTGDDESVLAHRLMGNWKPQEVTFQSLIIEKDRSEDLSRPYPFYLAYPLEEEAKALGRPEEWQIEYKWDGIRGQLVVRGGSHFVWSRGEELVTEKFPEYAPLAELLPNGTVIDGEILAWKNSAPLNFQVLQTRIGRKNVTKKILDQAPVVLMAYDLLEYHGKDIREQPISERRAMLEEVVEWADHRILQLSPLVQLSTWEAIAQEREQAREKGSEGLMLKRKNSDYKVGRKRGDWWKWKVSPLTIDAVMIYAMRGHGRRANLYTDYTFAVWDGDALVPFTKAYSGLTDAEFRKVDAFVKKNTVERFGPVRSVRPELVFEIAFEGIAKSSRHKSGVALRFPRMKRWRHDKPAKEANTLNDLNQLMERYG